MNRSWFRTFAFGLCLAQLLATTSLARAGDDAPGEKLLPKDTLVFFSISDVPVLRQKWDKSSM